MGVSVFVLSSAGQRRMPTDAEREVEVTLSCALILLTAT